MSAAALYIPILGPAAFLLHYLDTDLHCAAAENSGRCVQRSPKFFVSNFRPNRPSRSNDFGRNWTELIESADILSSLQLYFPAKSVRHPSDEASDSRLIHKWRRPRTNPQRSGERSERARTAAGSADEGRSSASLRRRTMLSASCATAGTPNASVKYSRSGLRPVRQMPNMERIRRV